MNLTAAVEPRIYADEHRWEKVYWILSVHLLGEWFHSQKPPWLQSLICVYPRPSAVFRMNWMARQRQTKFTANPRWHTAGTSDL